LPNFPERRKAEVQLRRILLPRISVNRFFLLGPAFVPPSAGCPSARAQRQYRRQSDQQTGRADDGEPSPKCTSAQGGCVVRASSTAAHERLGGTTSTAKVTANTHKANAASTFTASLFMPLLLGNRLRLEPCDGMAAYTQAGSAASLKCVIFERFSYSGLPRIPLPRSS
jgi:hypothetical protein